MVVVSAAASGSRFVPAFVVAVEFFHFVEFAVFNQRDKFFEALRAFDPKAGTAGTFMNLLQDERFNHQVEVEQGILEDECKEILQTFFKGLRERNKQRKQEAKEAQLSE